MILADKIANLRKKKGWSQEDLSNEVGVSRQAVSKWESATSIPDLNKIIKLSKIFGVSIDYLLNDDLGDDIDEKVIAEEFINYETEENIETISMETANQYIDFTKKTAYKVAMGVAMCIISPVVLIILSGLTTPEAGHIVSESLAVGVGLTIMLMINAVSVAYFVICAAGSRKYAFIKNEPIELAYGVKGMVEKSKQNYEEIHSRKLVIGIVLCILSPIPVVIMSIADDNDMLSLIGVAIGIAIVAVGVFSIVSTSIIYKGFKQLLEEGDYIRKTKARNKKNNQFREIYWSVVLAIYLIWSFAFTAWGISWIIWPVAAILYEVFDKIFYSIKK